jgi:hypothetical protein
MQFVSHCGYLDRSYPVEEKVEDLERSNGSVASTFWSRPCAKAMSPVLPSSQPQHL